MTIEVAIAEIKKFWNDEEELPFGLSDHTGHVDRLEKEFGRALPEDLKEYVSSFAPSEDFYFLTAGNPTVVYGIDHLKYVQEGYNYDSMAKSVLEDWDKGNFIFGDEGADPILVNMDAPEHGILRLEHGAGNWDYGDVVADNFAQFLLCSAALHHALSNFEEEGIVDDDNGFCLAKNAAKWYFPKMKEWAGDHYEIWCGVFDNN